MIFGRSVSLVNDSELRRLLAEADQHEFDHNWANAADLLQKALRETRNEESQGELAERIGYASSRAARQAANPGETSRWILDAISFYDNARSLYRRSNQMGANARSFRCSAIIAYLRSYLEPNVAKKKELLDQSWTYAKDSLTGFTSEGDSTAYGQTLSLLALKSTFGVYLERDPKALEKTVREAVQFGEKGLEILSASDDLRRANLTTAYWLGELSAYVPDPVEKGELDRRARRRWQEISDFPDEKIMLHLLECPVSPFFLESTDKTISLFRAALHYAQNTKDKILIGSALDKLAYHTLWMTYGDVAVEEARNLLDQARQCAHQAADAFSSVSFVNPFAATGLWSTC